MNFSLNLTQEQKLIMTEQMQLSVKILQLSSYDLEKLVEKEVEENPLLEIQLNEVHKENEYIKCRELIKYLNFDNYSDFNKGEINDDYVSPFMFISSEKSLKEYLKEQIIDIVEEDYIKNICNYIIENIDNRGYLIESVENISLALNRTKDNIEKSLNIIQNLNPYGVGARNLSECLKIQCHKKDIKDEKLYYIIDNNLEDIAKGKYNVIANDLNISLIQVQGYVDYIKQLNPRPASGFYTGENIKYIRPDAYIEKEGYKYCIIMNEDIMPKLTINKVYKDIMQHSKDKFEVDYIKEKLNNASFLMKSIEQRKNTLYKVLEEILKLQLDYFQYGDKYLKPMTLKEIADGLSLHESTISRAIKDKYIYTNTGMLKIKDLFTTGLSVNGQELSISSIEVKKYIEELMGNENRKKPLSDQKLADLLQEKGVNISRRTVAKYREEMGIKSSQGRKRY